MSVVATFSQLRWQVKAVLGLLVASLVVGGGYMVLGGPANAGASSSSSSPSASGGWSLPSILGGSKPLTVCTNTWGGYAPGYYYNDGLNPSKESRFYKEQGVQVGFVNIDDIGPSRDAFKADQCQVLWITADSFPTESDGLKDQNPKIFFNFDWSRKGDAIVTVGSINSVQHLRGKKVALATASPSVTLLAKALEAGSLKISDLEVIWTDTAIQAADLFKAGKVDAAVVWSPDDQDCLVARPGSRVLLSTGDLPYAIADVFYAKEETIKERHDELVSFVTGWLVASAELNASSSARKKAAKIMAEAWSHKDSGLMEIAVENVRYTTYGDNLNFFEMEGAARGTVTGEELYDSMSSVFAELNLAPNNVPSWESVTDTSVLEAVGQKLKPTGTQAAEGSFKFSQPTTEEAQAPAVASKPLPVNFATNSAELDLAAKATIDKNFASVAKSFASVRIRIEGNTDNTGPAELNRELSLRRAQSAADYLARKYGFDPNRFVVVGNGPDKPVAPNTTPEGKAANRRTTFEVVR